ncbi:unnamed protein product [Calicophoron daubneyi]|uniref:MARVEL domain-containing protein n=1 Tax=Calicophoron daubneyi TaxID=300641 RepID=A0AAV2T811_CALDB
MASLMKCIFVITLLLTVLLGIVGIGLRGSSTNGSKDKCTVAFSVLGILFFAFAAIIYLVLMCMELAQYKALMITTVVLVILGFIWFACAAGCSDAGQGRGRFTDWLLSALWTSVIATIMAVLFLFIDPNNMA